MRLARRRAGNITLHSLNSMNEAVLLQKLQRSIRDRRLVPEPVLPQRIQHFVRPQGAPFFKEYLKHPPSYGRQPEISFFAQPVDFFECFFSGGICHSIVSVQLRPQGVREYPCT